MTSLKLLRASARLLLKAKRTPVMRWLMYQTSISVPNTSREEKTKSSKVLPKLITEFVVSHEVTITVEDIDRIGELADRLLKT